MHAPTHERSQTLTGSLCDPALTEGGYVGAPKDSRHGSSVQIRRRKASGDPYWAYSGVVHRKPVDVENFDAVL
ncbi:Receptor-type tyrosine-protein phosphatase gamma [Fukomys damarensis]|uniref:Receptor-type tyrosine-protein phosphatase gamma n=1 Tax=Fukomys damarensis TaxID=885580 RepID=A0A091D4U3_FUKDA|nr:Receptor-type tyrosine-protein phosphatase gamma [Fukomys damarensis]